jgi:hypothetical protein
VFAKIVIAALEAEIQNYDTALDGRVEPGHDGVGGHSGVIEVQKALASPSSSRKRRRRYPGSQQGQPSRFPGYAPGAFRGDDRRMATAAKAALR